MNSKEWNLNSGEPELLKMFGRWEKRKDVPHDKAGVSDSLQRREIEIPKEINIGQVILDEIKKFHQIENGFSLEKIRDISVDINGNVINMQLLLVKTPWKELPTFFIYSPINKEGFEKIASIISGGVKLDIKGSMQNPQPFWVWNTLTVDGLDKVEQMGQPVMVELNGKRYFDFLSNFFKKENSQLFK